MMREMLRLEDIDGKPIYATREDGLLVLDSSHRQVKLTATSLGKLLDFTVDVFFPGGKSDPDDSTT